MFIYISVFVQMLMWTRVYLLHLLQAKNQIGMKLKSKANLEKT